MSSIQILMEMGFPQSKAERAIAATDNQGVEAAMEWLLAHNDELLEEPQKLPDETENNIESEVAPVTDKNEESVDGEKSESPIQDTDAETANSLICDDCGKLFKSQAEVEFHAAKSGHSNFSESTQEVKPLSEEEKKEQLRILEEKIRARRMLKEEEDRREMVEKEKVRRKTGQEMLEAKKRQEEEEIRKIAELRRKEKLDAKMARQRVLEQIELDKQARREKFGTACPESSSTSSTQPVRPDTVSASVSTVKKEYDQTRIQVRLTNGQTLTQTFGSKEELAAVRLYIEMHRTDGSGPFSLMTTFPKKVFGDEDMEKPLYELGLVPSAVLIIRT